MVKGQKNWHISEHLGTLQKKAMRIIAWYSPANITHFIALIEIKCKFGKVNYLKTPKRFRRSAPKMWRIRRKYHFQRPPKYTYLGAFGVNIKFSKKNNTWGGNFCSKDFPLFFGGKFGFVRVRGTIPGDFLLKRIDFGF